VLAGAGEGGGGATALHVTCTLSCASQQDTVEKVEKQQTIHLRK
jgi:hypothetical protein